MSRLKTHASGKREPCPAGRRTKASKAAREPSHAPRETIESIALAVILAFLFRAFVAEAFVIPTGSMAPTLRGQHKDVQCPECGYWYQAGASSELDEETYDQRERQPPRTVVATMCPLCRYQMALDLEGNANHASFSGDRILVSKFAYDFAPPERWDVIVFKFPFNAKQNYIKRLVGLPNETIRLWHGDVFVRQPGDVEFVIARKPDHKLLAMLQLVDDTKYVARHLAELGWPARWQGWAEGGSSVADLWSTGDQGHTYETPGLAGQDLWLRYRHVLPTANDWALIESGRQPPMVADRPSELITDFYAYNAFTTISSTIMKGYRAGKAPESEVRKDLRLGSGSLDPAGTYGLHWVSDLALEGDVEVLGDHGELLLLLVKGGVHYTCRIDVASGRAVLSIDGGRGAFVGSDGLHVTSPAGLTKLQGRGTYRIRYTNVDAEIRLWVNEQRVAFDGATTYVPYPDLRPVTSDDDPGDLAPVGVGTRDVALHIQRLRVLRDVYYVATDGSLAHEYLGQGTQEIRRVLQSPGSWPTTKLFDSQAAFEITMESGRLFPLGDNSPQSYDARMWTDHQHVAQHYVPYDLLIGKALLIYWPHPWYRPIPYLPNFKRMQLIH